MGMIGLPDHLVHKPAKLTPEEKLVIQTHPVVGAEMLQTIANQYPFAMDFFRMANEIVRHHHERFDGTGYPDRLAQDGIPLSARILHIADVYDALRSRRSYRPALSHSAATRIMLNQSDGDFDPALLQCFKDCLIDFEVIYSEAPD